MAFHELSMTLPWLYYDFDREDIRLRYGLGMEEVS